MMRFHDRADAGRRLAPLVVDALQATESAAAGRPVVLALPRGGVPVARPIADAVGAQLDVYVVRKLGTTRHPEFGVGAMKTSRPISEVMA